MDFREAPNDRHICFTWHADPSLVILPPYSTDNAGWRIINVNQGSKKLPFENHLYCPPKNIELRNTNNICIIIIITIIIIYIPIYPGRSFWGGRESQSPLDLSGSHKPLETIFDAPSRTLLSEASGKLKPLESGAPVR